MKSFHVIIPARYQSTRLPGKCLLDIGGKPMIAHVYERAKQSGAKTVMIATDDEKIQKAAQAFSADVIMTKPSHPNGTSRLAEVIERVDYHPDDIIVNVQGDEPFIPPENISQVAEILLSQSEAAVATLCTPIETKEERQDPNVVKVVMDKIGNALYFSRALIPFVREQETQQKHFRHIGLYAYRAHFIKTYLNLEPCLPEQQERLEQLRVLWHGYKIHVAIAKSKPGISIDTEEDYRNCT